MYSSLLDRDVKHILIQFTTQHVGNVDVFESVTTIDRSIDPSAFRYQTDQSGTQTREEGFHQTCLLHLNVSDNETKQHFMMLRKGTKGAVCRIQRDLSAEQ